MTNSLDRSLIYRADMQTAFDAIPDICRLLNEKKILVTGATGMIGSCIVDMLAFKNGTDYNARIFAAARDVEKLKFRFEEHWKKNIEFIRFDAAEQFDSELKFDYIFHCASGADPRSYSADPTGILLSNVEGTNTMLKRAVESRGRLLFVSSGEYYGDADETVSEFIEDYCGYIDCSSPRSCYPIGKRAGEVLCQCYKSQYNADVVIVRPCHIFGPTMTASDSRAVSEFIRKAVNGENIIMKSEGLTERSQCYVVDAAAAMLYVMLHGETGEAYNIADEKYRMTIGDFARKTAAFGGTDVVFELPDDAEKCGYSPRTKAVLSNSKLCSLGWQPADIGGSAIEHTIKILCGE